MVAPLAVVAAGWYLPDRAVPVAGLPELAGLPAAERETCLGLGIDEVRCAGELTAFDLAVRAGQRALAAAGLAGPDLDGLILIEPRVPEAFLTSAATRVQAALGADRSVAFTVGGLGCGSVTPALLAARGLLAADPAVGSVLVVHGSTPATPRRYRHPVTVNGDGGFAAVLARHGPVRIVDVLQETSGEYWDLFGVDFRDRPADRWREECRDLPTYTFRLAVETGRRLVDLRRRVLERNGLGPDDVAGHLGQNLSGGAFRFTEEALGVRIAPGCAQNLRRYGHLGPVDVLLNLYEEIEQGRLGEGQRALLLSVSPSAAWSALLVEVGATDPPAVYL